MPVLSAMGSNVLRTGAVGSGQAMKALNNLVSTGGFLIGIEALLIGQRFGLDPAVMTDVLNAATGMNNSTQKKFKQFVLSRKFDAGFTMGLLAKDLSIALQVGRETGNADAVLRAVQGTGAGRPGNVRPGRRSHRDGEVVRDPRRHHLGALTVATGRSGRGSQHFDCLPGRPVSTMIASP